jgi:hypothetical protein
MGRLGPTSRARVPFDMAELGSGTQVDGAACPDPHGAITNSHGPTSFFMSSQRSTRPCRASATQPPFSLD